jgi:hypothetical protein
MKLSGQYQLLVYAVDVNLPGDNIVTKQENNETRIYTGGQAVSRWLPTAMARVRAQVTSCGICGGQSGTGQFFRVLRVALPQIPPTVAHWLVGW